MDMTDPGCDAEFVSVTRAPGARRHSRPDGVMSTSDADDSGPEPDSALTFPDLPRLELDQLLVQLVERAHEVISSQERLRGLLHANQIIASDLALSAVLPHIVEAARELVGARYAALGVLDSTGRLTDFIHAGMPPADVERIGALPHGRGLLGALIDNPSPIRIDSIADDPRSCGFPPGHPPMTSFLTVPVRVRDEIVGNLYLADGERGVFSADDEELAKALAAAAGVAIVNARLYETAQTRQKWLRASTEITRALLSAKATHPLQLIAEQTLDIAVADLVTVVLPVDAQRHLLRVDVAVGPGAERLGSFTVPVDGSLSGRVLLSGTPLQGSWAEERSGPTPAVLDGLDIGPVLAVPLVGSRQVNGVLTAVRTSDRAAFTEEDLDMVAGFASQASLAIELAETQREQQRIVVDDERDRIAADLHDHVIQRLFASGLSLQRIAGRSTGATASDLASTIYDLDETISEIRITIFQLHRGSGDGDNGLRARLLDIVGEVTSAMGFAPDVRFGELDTLTVPDMIADDLVAVLREALTNVARHAGAAAARATVTVSDGLLTLEVSDDGIGMNGSTRWSGLASLRVRAERHDGRFTVTTGKPAGTRLSWSVPLR
jgi:signal transduction histidine kinase